MLTVDHARRIADQWRPRFADPAAFDQSWSRFFELVGDPDAERLHNWLAKDQSKDAVKHAGIISEPVLPTHSSYSPGDESSCPTCKGRRYVRHDVPIDHSMFGKAIPCPKCNR